MQGLWSEAGVWKKQQLCGVQACNAVNGSHCCSMCLRGPSIQEFARSDVCIPAIQVGKVGVWHELMSPSVVDPRTKFIFKAVRFYVVRVVSRLLLKSEIWCRTKLWFGYNNHNNKNNIIDIFDSRLILFGVSWNGCLASLYPLSLWFFSAGKSSTAPYVVSSLCFLIDFPVYPR